MLVKLKAGVSEEGKKSLHKKHGAQKLKEFPKLRLHHVKLKSGMAVEDAVKEYQADPDVEYAQPNYLYTAQGVPSDARFAEQWALNNTGQTGGTPGVDIKAPAAWDLTTGSSQQLVAVIDSGIDYNHPDLAPNIYSSRGIDPYNNDSDPFDDYGHGTHLAGIIGAAGHNGLGVTGINWNVKLVACKVMDYRGYGWDDKVIECLQYLKGLKQGGANIVAANLAWEGGNFSQALYDALNEQRDTLFVAAAGNWGSDLDAKSYSSYPAGFNLPNVVTVAATDSKDYKSTTSSYGKTTVDLSAPGENILSTLPANNGYNISGGYGVLSGTSTAAAHVTGVAALLKAQDPGRSTATIRNLLIAGGDSTTSTAGRTVSGKRLNAYGSMTCTDAPVFSAIRPPKNIGPGYQSTLTALSINCAAPVGPVTVTTSKGEVITLADDGVAPDLEANDGIFTATWTATSSTETLRFSSPAGSDTVEYPALSITSSYLPNPSPNVPYAGTLAAKGGSAPYQWRVASGALPPGMTLNASTGEIAGTAASAGSYYFSIEVSDAYGGKAVKDLSLVVTPQPYSESWRTLMSPCGAWINPATLLGNDLDVAVDGNGNSYVVSPSFGPSYQLGVVKYDRDGKVAWTKQLNQESIDRANAVTVDSEGNLYVAGSTGSLARYLLLKFDTDGNEIWRREPAGSVLKDVVTDAQGNVYVAGNGYGLQTVKYDRDGNELWAREFQMAKMLDDPHLAVDGAGNVFLTGHNANTYVDPSYDLVLLKYDVSGNQLWFRTYDNGGYELGRDIVANSRGEIYVTGASISAPMTQFLMKFDAEGNVLWNRPYSAGKGTSGFGLALDSREQVYVTGSAELSPYGGQALTVLKYDAGGNLLWSTSAGHGDGAEGERIAIGPDGEIIVAGVVRAGDERSLATIKYSYGSPMVALSYNPQGSGAGTVTLDPGGSFINSFSRNFEPATVVILTATPRADSNFTGWGGACSGTGPCTVTLNEAQSVTATFDHKPIPLNFTRLGAGQGGVTFTPGTACFGDCPQFYDAGTEVSLTATAAGTSRFTGWGGACSGTGPCTIVMAQAQDVSATFEHGPRLIYQPVGTGIGSITHVDYSESPWRPQFCDGNCSAEYREGTTVTVTAEAYPNATFVGWEGSCSGTDACTVTLSADTVVTARFTKIAPKTSLAAGALSSMALFGNTLWGWGDNSYGELGASDSFWYFSTPVEISAAPPLVKVALSRNGATGAGIALDGSIWAWGNGRESQFGVPGVQNQYPPAQVPGLTGMAELSLGMWHGLGVKADGSLVAWGDNSAGQVGDGSYPGGTMILPTVLPNSSGFISVAAGNYYSVALKGDGSVWTWGQNSSGQLGFESGPWDDTYSPRMLEGVSGVTAIAAGADHTVALKADGTVLTWGRNDQGQLGDGTTVQRAAPQAVPGLTGVTAIAAGDEFTMALKADGTLWTWGRNGHGQLGIGSTVAQSSPVQVTTLASVVAIAAGQAYALAETSDGVVWSWGYNDYGALGDASSYDRATPVKVRFAYGDAWPPRTPTTTASPAGGTYSSAKMVVLSPSKSATIYYTLDGTTPTAQSAVYMGPLAISSTTTLRYFASATDGSSSEQVKTQIYSFPVIADFSSQVTSGYAPLIVSFSDLSSMADSWLWIFGDGASDTARNPVHVYNDAGTYSVSLTAFGASASDTRTKHRLISVQKCSEAPVRIPGPTPAAFADLLSAYLQAADNDVLELQEYNFSSDLIFDKEIGVSLKGGYDCSYQDNLSAAGIFGKLTVKAGRVKLENIRLR